MVYAQGQIQIVEKVRGKGRLNSNLIQVPFYLSQRIKIVQIEVVLHQELKGNESLKVGRVYATYKIC